MGVESVFAAASGAGFTATSPAASAFNCALTRRKRGAPGDWSHATMRAVGAGATASSNCAANMRARPGAIEGANLGAKDWKSLSAAKRFSRTTCTGDKVAMPVSASEPARWTKS